ncbi:hypothetical protein POTOM_015122 [Populus tomentosa]|uniref:GAG-pre-integrase domain-containing protein n=1 Tax=Populus tomentosa TaxID=118781 RepID=A0A8X8CWV1_POPTO|nr:hypothetical protein POTOM_015122 [Populus tomentosa]
MEEDLESGDEDMLFISSSSDHPTDSWILDSTFTYHMTPNKYWLNNYRRILDLRKNLISLGILDCDGFSFKSKSGAIVIEFETDSIVLWHKQVGHMDERKIMEIHKKNLLKGCTQEEKKQVLKNYSNNDNESIRDVNKLKTLLSRELGIKDLGTAKKILVMKINRDRTTRRLWWRLWLSQYSYIEKVLEMFIMDNAKPLSWISDNVEIVVVYGL